MKIFLVGGGTGGPTAPLLSVAEGVRDLRPKSQVFFIGTRKGVEEKMVSEFNFPMAYLTIPAGKWRRYFSMRNVTDLFKTFYGFFKSLYLIRKYRPDVIFGAGSYVQVPVAWAGFFLGVPVVVHQQDFDILLSTRLVAPIARAVTFSFRYTGFDIADFSGLFRKIGKAKANITGNPVRKSVLNGSAAKARELFNLSADYPTILVIGGGTGSAKLNEIVIGALDELAKYVQVLHITGGKNKRQLNFVNNPHYHSYDFMAGKDLAHAYAIADLVVSRGGMSTITEIARLGKVSILVPLPESPQINNVRFMVSLGLAVGIFEEFLTPELLVRTTRKILWDKELQESICKNVIKLMPPDSDMQIARIITKLAQEKNI